MLPERQIQRTVGRYLAQRGAWELNTHSMGYQRRGVPDLIACLDGRFLALEVKRPGRKPTPLQARTLARIRLAEGVAGVVHSVEEVLALMVRVQGDES